MENQQLTYKEKPIELTVYLSSETLQARREWQDIFKVLKGKIYSQDYATWQVSHSKLMEKSKALQTSKYQRVFSTTKPALQQMLNTRERKDLQKQTQNN